MENVEKYYKQITEMAVEYAPKLALAILTLIFGWIAIKIVIGFVKKQLTKSHVDVSLVPFVAGVLSVVLKATLLVAVAGMVGIKTTSFVAIIGAAGLAVGLALQGSLSNFAGSVLILFFKPFKVGDVVEMQGESGTVEEIKLLYTKIATFDNKVIFMPNGKVANDNIKNISFNDIRRVDFTFGIGYDDDIDRAKSIFREILEKDSRIIQDKGLTVKLSELADSSVNFIVRCWAKKEDYWDIYWDTMESTKKALDSNNISIPYPQRDVHIHNSK